MNTHNSIKIFVILFFIILATCLFYLPPVMAGSTCSTATSEYSNDWITSTHDTNGEKDFWQFGVLLALNAGKIQLNIDLTEDSQPNPSSVNWYLYRGTGCSPTLENGSCSSGDPCDSNWYDVVAGEVIKVQIARTSAPSSGTSWYSFKLSHKATGMVQFKLATYSVDENAGGVRIYVSRTTGSSGAASVDYTTADGSAMAGSDYIDRFGTLHWDDGDSEDKPVDIDIINDDTPENSETFTVNLSNAVGATLGSPSETTVTINGPNDFKPNLRLDSFITEPENADPGQKVTAKIKILNAGTVQVGPTSHLIFINHIEDSRNFTMRSIPRVEFQTPTLAPGEMYPSEDFLEFEVELPLGLAPGWDYFVVTQLDWRNTLAESDENDNNGQAPLFGNPSLRGKVLGPRNQSPNSGDPVNTALGNFTYQNTDLSIFGRGLNVNFSRYYNSQGGLDSPMGVYWNHSYNIFLHEDVQNKSPTGTITVVYGEGKRHTYTPDGSGGFIPPPGVYSSLVKNLENTYTLTHKDQVKYNFDSNGKLTTILDRNDNAISLTYSGNRLDKITDTVGREVVLLYDNLNGVDRIISIQGPVRPKIQYDYDANGNLFTMMDARGHTTQYVYATNHDDKHLLAKIVNARGKEQIKNYYGTASGVEDGHGYYVIKQEDADNKTTLYSYDVASRVTTITGPDNKVTKHYYDEQYRFTKEEDPLRNFAEFHYDANGNQDWVKDKNGNTTSYTYDDRGNILTKTDPKGNITKIEYFYTNDPAKKIEAYNKLNHTWIYEYDEVGNLIKETDPEGKSTSYVYNFPYGQVVSKTDANNNTTEYYYEDGQGNLTRVKRPASQNCATNQLVYTYDGVGRKTHMVDANGNETVYHYDHNDNLEWEDDTSGNLISFTYDENNNKTSIRNRRGYTTTYTYDDKDMLKIVRNSLSQEIITEYDVFDRKKKVIDQWGNETKYTYDDVGNLIAITNAKDEVIQFKYDPNGNKTKIIDAAGSSWEYVYDENNRLISEIDPLQNETKYEYNQRGWITKVTDAKGKETQFEYYKTARLKQVTDPEGGQAVYTYDGVGNRRYELDPRLKTVEYQYDALNRLVKIVDRNAHETSFTYDCMGNMETKTDGNGSTITYDQYDRDGRLKLKTFPDLTTVAYNYDLNGNLVEMTDSLGTTYYTYDELDRLTSVTDPYNKTVSYTYELSSNMTTLVYPDGKTVTYDHDSLNRLWKVHDWFGNTQTYAYDNRGNLIKVFNSEEASVDYTYDLSNRLLTAVDKTSLYATPISSFEFTLDKVGNRTNVTMDVPLAPVFQKETIPGTYDPENQISTWGSKFFSFDNAGRQISKTQGSTTTNYTYNLEDRLTEVSDGSNTYQYKYNGKGDRLAKVMNGTETRYVLDLNGEMSRVLCETDSSGNVTAYYIHGAGLLYKITPSGNRYHYHFDPLGSTIALTDNNENVTDKYAYDPFGKLANMDGTTPNPFRYVGQHGVMDEENGLLFMRARFYDADLKQFLSRDPIKGEPNDTQSLNPYTYARNNPLIVLDPSGLVNWREAGLGLLTFASGGLTIVSTLTLAAGVSGTGIGAPIGIGIAALGWTVGWSGVISGVATIADAFSEEEHFTGTPIQAAVGTGFGWAGADKDVIDTAMVTTGALETAVSIGVGAGAATADYSAALGKSSADVNRVLVKSVVEFGINGVEIYEMEKSIADLKVGNSSQSQNNAAVSRRRERSATRNIMTGQGTNENTHSVENSPRKRVNSITNANVRSVKVRLSPKTTVQR